MNHPVAQALAKITVGVAPPATLTVVSSFRGDDAELALNLEKLKAKGYSVIRVDGTNT